MQKVKLGDVCEILDNQRVPITASERKSGPYPYYGANGLQDYVDGYIFDDDLVLLAEDGGNFGSKDKPIAYRVSGKCWVNNHAHVLKPKDNIDVNYLCYSLMFYNVDGLVNGATRQKLTQKDMRKISIPLPLIEEQKAIAEQLDKVSILIEKRKQQLSLLDTLVKSKFVEMFENQKYPKCKIGDLVEKDIKSARKNFQPNEVIRYIDISSIDNKLNRMKGFSRLLFGEAPSRAQQCIEKGDILVSTVRPNLRNIAINSFEFTNMVASSGFCILRAQKCERIYLLGAVLSENFSRKMSEITTGANYPAIKDSDVLSYYIPNPPKEIQQIFAHFAEEIEKTKAKVEQSLVALEFLKKSLMQKYFG